MNRLVNRHVNAWFQYIQHDGQSPAITANALSTLFLQHVNRLGLSIWLPNIQFRHRICEALCTMYIAAKRHTIWRGPASVAPRPTGWTIEDEQAWSDHLHFNYFSYELWQSIWSQIPTAFWESRIPHWRDAIERILLHYLVVDDSFKDDYYGQAQTATTQYHQDDGADLD